MSIVYKKDIVYGPNHWAMTRLVGGVGNCVIVYTFEDVKVGIKINPSDYRGYRLIGTIVNDDMSSVLNRKYLPKEYEALFKAMAAVVSAMQELGLVVQAEMAGNNSQSMDGDTIVVGNENEPGFLHFHIICRGVIGKEYFPNAPLMGPKVGMMFNMRGDAPATLANEGNSKKEKWTDVTKNSVMTSLVKLLKSSPLPSGLQIE